MNAKMIEAMKGIRDNLSILVDEVSKYSMEAVSTEDTAEPEVAPKEAPVKNKGTKSTMSRKEREASEKLPDVKNGNLSREELDSLSYNNLKKVAKDLGISATGAREELTEKILNADTTAPAEEDSVKEETPAPASKSKKSPKPKALGKKPTSVVEPEPEEEEEDEEEDPIVAKVNEAVEDMSNEEIADLLTEVGVKAKGKRQALIAAVIKAVEEGKIDLDDEDEEDESDESDEDVSDEETAEVETDDDSDEEYDVNDPENPDMTEERKEALNAFDTETRDDFKNGELTRKDMIAWLNDFHGTKDTMKKKSDKDILDEYITCSMLFINDEGEIPEEEGAYNVNGVPYCCGRELSYNEDNNTYICEVCGAEYEAGDEDEE